MRNTNKKGFTIVELVIVIAVIAILAAVLIPVFSGIIARANLSADQKAEHDMNTALAIANNPDNLDDVIDALIENGFNGENLVPVSKDYSFVWNESTKKIELVKTAEIVAGQHDLEAAGVKYIDVVASDAATVIAAINNGSEYIKLEANITLDRDLSIESGNVTLNLNGHTFNSVQNANGRSSVIYVRADAALTVENGTFNVRSLQNYGDLTIKEGTVINAMDITGGGCIKNKTGGTVVIEGGTFNIPNFIAYEPVNKGGACAVENNGGTVVIKGGTFTTNTESYLISNLSGEMTIEGGTFKSYRGVLACEGGTLNVTGGSFTLENHPETGKAPSGYHIYCIAGTATLGSNVEFKGLADKIYVNGGTLNDNR